MSRKKNKGLNVGSEQEIIIERPTIKSQIKYVKKL